MSRPRLRVPRSGNAELTRSGLVARVRPLISAGSYPRSELTVMAGIPFADTLAINAWGAPETYGTFGQPCGGYRVDSSSGHSQELMLTAANSNGIVKINFDRVNPGPVFAPVGAAMNERLWNGKMVMDSPGACRAWVTVPATGSVRRVWSGARPDGFALGAALNIVFVVDWVSPIVSASMYDLCVCRGNTVTLRGLPPNGSVRVTPAGLLSPAPSVMPVDALGVAVWDADFTLWPANLTVDVYAGAGATGALVREGWRLLGACGGDVYQSRKVLA